MKSCTLTLHISYDPQVTDPESLASAFDTLLETALSTPGILEEYGDLAIGEFLVAPDESEECDGPAEDSGSAGAPDNCDDLYDE